MTGDDHYLSGTPNLIMPRRKPFSSKQKKQQLQQKRQRKKDKGSGDIGASKDKKAVDFDLSTSSEESSEHQDGDKEATKVDREDGVVPDEETPRQDWRATVVKVNLQPATKTESDRHGKFVNPNRYRLHFEGESKEEIERRKRLAKSLPVDPLPETSLEVSVDDVYVPGTVLDIPKRPPWSYSMTKEQLESQEEAMFDDYLKNIYSKYTPESLSYFEHNLETWRQLWRVLEISDVILLITDIRHPALHYSPALYDYIVKDLKKTIILVLNKVDLVSPSVAVAWRHYFLSRFSQLSVVCFSSFPNREASTQANNKFRLKFKRGGCGLLPSAVGPRELLQVIESIYREKKIDLEGWKEKLTMERVPLTEEDDEETGNEGEEPVAIEDTTSAAGSSPLVKDRDGEALLTIGMIGHPNVGKSSLINALMGKKLVSTSRTPGHTKHFQTLFLSRSVRLCDCPGLVFPSLVDRRLQILAGIYPIAQVKEPYSVVGYLAQRLPLVRLLSLEHPEGVVKEYKRTAGRRLGDCDLKHDLDPKLARLNLKDRDHKAMWRKIEEEREWTPWNICDAWAEKRGYHTPRGARLDTYRAANNLLRLAADGRICLFFRPPGYSKEKAVWESHPEVSEIIELQRRAATSKDSKLIKESSDLLCTSAQMLSHNDQSTVNLKNKFELLNKCSDDSS